jgi:uncharacterized membrane protein
MTPTPAIGLRAFLLLTLAGVPACVQDPTAENRMPGLEAAKGGPGVSVQSADPAFGHRGDVHLKVAIAGSGFTQGANAKWERNGVPDPKIAVFSTEFVSATKLIATVDIALDADLALYDLAVTLVGGKKGIGTEKFEVTTATLLAELNGQGGVAKDINDADEIVGHTNNRAVRWDLLGGLEDLGAGQANAIDAAGTTIVGSTSLDLGASQASLWTGGPGSRSRTLLPTSCATGTVPTSMASAVSANGRFAGGWLRVSTGPRKGNSQLRAVRWDLSLGGCTLLPIPPGGFPGPTVKDVNDLGMATGHGVFWDADLSGTQLPPWPGQTFSHSFGISEDGSVVVGRTGFRAVYWRRNAGVLSQPIELPSGACSQGKEGTAADINDAGLIVGTGCDGAAHFWQLTNGVLSGSGKLPGLGPQGAGIAEAVRNGAAPGQRSIVGAAQGHPVYWPQP